MGHLLFVVLAPVALVPLVGVAVVAWRRRAVPGGRALAAVSVFGALWLVFNTLSVVVPDPVWTVRLLRTMYLWIPLLSVAWVWFLLAYADLLTRPMGWVLGVLAALAVGYDALVLSPDPGGLIWTHVEVVPRGPFLAPVVEFGPASLGMMMTFWSVFIIAFGAVLRTYAHAPRPTRRLVAWIVFGAAVPLALNVAFVAGKLSAAEWFPTAKDFTPIGFAVSSGAFALGLFRYRLLDLRPVARAALVERIPGGMLVLDTEDRIVDANPSMRRILGDPPDLIGLPLDAVLTDRQREAVTAVRAEAEARLEIPFEHDGKRRYFEVRVSPLADRAGQPSGRLVLLHDVTQRRTQEVELRQRNAELDAFAHTVAHDLKNPIQAALAYAELLRDVGPSLPPERQRNAADQVVQAAWRLDGIVQDLLLLAGVSRREVEIVPTRMEDAVEGALARVARLVDESEATVSRPETWPIVRGYGPWIEAIWANYLSNAARYGGRAPRIVLGSEVADDVARFWVEDEGPGLSKAEQARLFVPFARLATEAEGHGLGLSIVRRIADRLGGDCGVESEPGHGSRFWFSLPLAAAVPQAPSLEAPSSIGSAEGVSV